MYLFSSLRFNFLSEFVPKAKKTMTYKMCRVFSELVAIFPLLLREE